MSLRKMLWTVTKVAGKADAPSRYLQNVAKYYLFRKILKRGCSLRLRRDLTLVSDGRSASTGCAVLFDVYYEPRLMHFLVDWLRCGDVFVDIGANIGIYSLLAARRVGAGSVLSIEANPMVFAHLARNVAANGLQNVRIVNCAVAETSGELFFDPVDGDCEGRLVIGGTQELTEGFLTVDAEPLPVVLRSQSLHAVSCMKLDVEGAELAVLAGAQDLLRVQRPVVMIDYYERSVAESLYDLGYAPYRYKRKRSGGGDLSLLPITAEQDHGSIFIHGEMFDHVMSRLASGAT